MNLNLTKEQKFYLCRLAALQFSRVGGKLFDPAADSLTVTTVG